MGLQLCPRCMQQATGDVCAFCGFDVKQYQSPSNALPSGTKVGHCTVGIVLAASRQAICYSAIDSTSGALVLLEEFFPSAAVKREGKDVVQTRPDAHFTEAAELFAGAETGNRPSVPVSVIREDKTVYRVYAVNPSDARAPQKAADTLLDNPIRFRGGDDRPLFAINTLPIPPLPQKRIITRKASGKANKWLLLAVILILLILAGLFAAWKLL